MRKTSRIYIDIKLLFVVRNGQLLFNEIVMHLLAQLDRTNNPPIQFVYQPEDIDPSNPDIFQLGEFSITQTGVLAYLPENFFTDPENVEYCFPHTAWDLTTPLKNPEGDAVFLSLYPELNRLARHAGCETIVDSFGALNREEILRTILTIAKNLTQGDAHLFFDFDDTMIENYHPYCLPGKPTLLHHLIVFMEMLVQIIKESFPGNYDAMIKKLHLHLLSARKSDEVLQQEYEAACPTLLKEALPAFLEEVHHYTGIRFTFSNIFCLGATRFHLFENKHTGEILGRCFYDPADTKKTISDYQAELQSLQNNLSKTAAENNFELAVYHSINPENGASDIYKGEHFAEILPKLNDPSVIVLIDDQQVQCDSMAILPRLGYRKATCVIGAFSPSRDLQKNSENPHAISFCEKHIAHTWREFEYNENSNNWRSHLRFLLPPQPSPPRQSRQPRQPLYASFSYELKKRAASAPLPKKRPKEKRMSF